MVEGNMLSCFVFSSGLIVGMAANELVVPVNTAPERPYYHRGAGQESDCLTINVDWGEEFIPGMLKIMEERDRPGYLFCDRPVGDEE